MDGEIGPGGPGLALELEVECRTSRRATRGRRHPVTVTADWALEGPHDLAAERVAAAFGGYTSCLGLADHVLPAAREAVQLLARRAPADITSIPDRGWMVGRPVTGCRCARWFFGTAQRAASHGRTVEHLATKHGADQRLLTQVLGAVGKHQDYRSPPDPTGRIAGLVRDSGGLAELWVAGMHPDRVAEIASALPWFGEALPVSFYLGVDSRHVDPGRLAEVLVRRPDPDIAAWLAWSEHAVAPGTGPACGDWLAMGVPVRDVEALLTAGTAPATCRDLAARTGRSERQAAIYLAGWARADCEPSPEQVLLLDRLGINPAYHPPVTAVNLLELAASEHGEPPARTDLAVLLAVAGTRRAALDLLERGKTSADDALALL